MTVMVSVWPDGPVKTVVEPSADRDVVRDAELPSGPVTDPFTVPSPRVKLRVMLWPFGPVVVEFTLPGCRVVSRLMEFPRAPVMTEPCVPAYAPSALNKAARLIETIREMDWKDVMSVLHRDRVRGSNGLVFVIQHPH